MGEYRNDGLRSALHRVIRAKAVAWTLRKLRSKFWLERLQPIGALLGALAALSVLLYGPGYPGLLVRCPHLEVQFEPPKMLLYSVQLQSPVSDKSIALTIPIYARMVRFQAVDGDVKLIDCLLTHSPENEGECLISSGSEPNLYNVGRDYASPQELEDYACAIVIASVKEIWEDQYGQPDDSGFISAGGKSVEVSGASFRELEKCLAKRPIWIRKDQPVSFLLIGSLKLARRIESGVRSGDLPVIYREDCVLSDTPDNSPEHAKKVLDLMRKLPLYWEFFTDGDADPDTCIRRETGLTLDRRTLRVYRR